MLSKLLNPGLSDGLDDLSKKGYDKLQNIVKNKFVQITPQNRNLLFDKADARGGAHSGFLVPEKNAENIAKQIKNILENEAIDPFKYLTQRAGLKSSLASFKNSLGVVDKGDGKKLFISNSLKNKKIEGLGVEDFLKKQLTLKRSLGDRKFKTKQIIDPETGLYSKIYTLNELAKKLNTSKGNIENINRFLEKTENIVKFSDLPILSSSVRKKEIRNILAKQSDPLFETKIKSLKKGEPVHLAHMLAKNYPNEYMPEQSLATLGLMDEFTNSVLMGPFDEIAGRLVAQADKLIKSVVVKDMSRLKKNVSPKKLQEIKIKLTSLNNQLKLLSDDTGGGVIVPQWNVNALGVSGIKKVNLYGAKNNPFSFAGKIDEIKNILPMSKTSEARKNLVLNVIPDLTEQMQNTTTIALKNMAPILKNKKIYDRIKKTAKSRGFVLPDEFIKLEKMLDNVDEYPSYTSFVAKDGGRVEMNKGGRVELAVGGQPLGSVGGSSLGRIGDGPTNKVGNIESMLAGIGAGLIDIPRGAFVLGSALIDMGLGTNNAAKVEKFFDELTDLDEKADATTVGGIVRLLTNLGIPGAQAFNMGTKATKAALLAKRNGNYFRITDPKLEERMKTALNGKGRLYATLGGAGAAGVSDAIFIGDVNKAGTLGDMFGGPTQLNENDENDSSKEVMNRMKFGLDSSLMMGVIGGTGSAIKTAVKRRNDMASDNDALDRFLSKLRPRGDKPQEFFEMERASLGARAGDVNYAGEVARSLDKHIDGIFPFVVNPFNKMGNNGRKEFMKEMNDVLLSGKADIGVTGRFDFGDLDPDMVKSLTAKMKAKGAKQSDIDGVFKEFYNIRGGWGHMFSRLGAKMDKTNLDEFRDLFSKKFSNYLGSTYEIFQNKSIIPMVNYRPSEEAVNKAMVMFKQSAKEAGEEITDAQARHYVDKIVEGTRPTSSPSTVGLYLDVPDFFANRTILDDLAGKNKVGLENFTDDAKQVFNELLGKIEDPMQTVLAGTGRLSLIARRNEFYNDLIKRSKEDITAGNKGFFYETEVDAINALGPNVKKVEIDASRTIEAGITNPMNGMYAEKSVAEAIEQSAMVQRDKEWYTQMYDSFILYPKATSQIAKTILSPITHVRNFVSAGAFAGANGLLPGVTVSPDQMGKAMKDAYRALQTNLPGSRIANDEYRELLRLGVVNSNVRLGDLQRLLKDVQFGSTLNAQTGLRGLTKQLSKAKKWTEDMYTAEDDFWKITSYALERQRLNDAYAKVGIKVDPKALNEEAASIVRNNIPNYDMVNEFVKGLRRLPFGNFVSFPAEIMRTTTNILGRGLKEINYQHTLDDGRVVNPLRGIGMKRLFGLGATVVAVPYGVTKGAQALYDVSDVEMDALRRFVPEWSRNSTLVPIKDRETGELKYIDFSHTNAYDTMIRPINTMINSIGKGVDEGEIMKNVAVGMFDATKETFSPFMSESIWFEAASDIILRGGRTREGRRLYTDQTPWGEKVSIVAGHIAKTQVPGSVEAFKRLDLAVEGVDIVQKGKYDKYGRTYELGDELLGFAGARAVKVDPLRSMKFKIAEYRTGVNNARREFTTPLLRGGPIDPADIVDRYAVANQALYNVNKELFDDYYAARTLGTKSSAIDGQFADRVSTKQLNAIKTGRFKPFIPSENIIKAFGQNAREIGERNPYRIAERQINRMAQKYNNLPLYDTTFPVFENPFNLPSAPLPPEATNVAPVGGLSQGSVIQTGMNNPLINNRTMQQGQRVFGSNDPIFGS